MRVHYVITIYLYTAISIIPHYILPSVPYGLDLSKSKSTQIQQQIEQMNPQQRLWWACSQGNVLQIQRSLQQNVDPQKTDENGNTIVHMIAQTISTAHKSSAIITQQVALFTQLLKYFPKQKNYSVLRQRNSKGDTPIHILMTGSCPCQKTISLCLEYDPKCALVQNSGGKFPDQCVSSTQEKLFTARCTITSQKETE